MKKLLLLVIATYAFARVPDGYYACEKDFGSSKPIMLKIVKNKYRGQSIREVKDGIYLFSVKNFRCFEEDKD